MKRIYIIILFFLTTMIGCSSINGFYDNNPVLVQIIENSIGKPVDYVYDQLQTNLFDPEHLQSKAMTNEELQDFGIEIKFPPKDKSSTSEIVVRLRFDMHREVFDSSRYIKPNTYTSRPKVFQMNGKYIVEFIRVIEYKDGKVIFSRIFDKSTGSSLFQNTEIITSLRKRKKI